MSSTVKVRFAPSPTGSMHVGNVRTAIFNWLFARANRGEFLLRIEDTDLARSKKEWVDVILQGLTWLGLDWDNQPLYQSQRMAIYRELADRMLAEGIAYRCFCHPDELEARRKTYGKQELAFRYDGHCRSLSPRDIEARKDQPFALRLLSDSQPITYNDGVHGEINVSGDELDDLILMRRDGTPTYNFAVVVDDHDMGITHVLRGDDHISNTPKQIQIYRALGWEHPQFLHLPLILGLDKKPLAKRHGSASLDELRASGILPQTLFNYLALLGWAPGDDREIMTREELVTAFSMKGISSSSAVFDPAKLEWMNGQHLSIMHPEEIYRQLRHIFKMTGLDVSPSREEWLRAISLLKSRPKLLLNISSQAKYMFLDPDSYDPEGVFKHWKLPQTAARLSQLMEILASIDPFEENNIENQIRALADQLGISAAKLIHPTRLALTGTTYSPGLFELIACLGRDTVLRRLKNAVNFLENQQQSESNS